jgi:transketolase
MVLEAADRLRTDGIHARVLSMHTIAPLDAEAVASAVTETGAIVTVEEHSTVGGLGSAVADVLAELDGPKIPFRKVGVPPRRYNEIGSQAYMRGLLGDVATVARDLCARRSPRRDLSKGG